MVTFEKIAIGQEDDYTAGCLLDYNYFNKEQALDADTESMQQINFTGNLIRKNNDGQDINDNTTMFFIMKELEETIVDFSYKFCDFFYFNVISVKNDSI